MGGHVNRPQTVGVGSAEVMSASTGTPQNMATVYSSGSYQEQLVSTCTCTCMLHNNISMIGHFSICVASPLANTHVHMLSSLHTHTHTHSNS